MTEYHCPTCKSDDVEAYEYMDNERISPRRVHVYCNESECGWAHRGIARGVFEPGGSEYGKVKA